MGRCDFCGESAGWLQSRHPACAARAEDARKRLRELALNGTLAGRFYAELEAEAKQITAGNRVPFDQFRDTLIQGVNDAAGQIALKSPITEEELVRVVDILKGFGIDQYTSEWKTQRRWYGLALLGMSHTLWQVLHGITHYYDGSGRMQFNLHSGELPIFSAGKVTFARRGTVSNYVRNFGGLSMPIGGGIYYHVGGSQAHREQVSGLLPIDVGEMLITNQALYFGGPKETLRIRLNDVLRHQSYVDGVGVHESHGAPKVFVPDFSGMDTGWFFFNLLSALTSKLHQ